jgi:hypothetical protein
MHHKYSEVSCAHMRKRLAATGRLRRDRGVAGIGRAGAAARRRASRRARRSRAGVPGPGDRLLQWRQERPGGRAGPGQRGRRYLAPSRLTYLPARPSSASPPLLSWSATGNGSATWNAGQTAPTGGPSSSSPVCGRRWPTPTTGRRDPAVLVADRRTGALRRCLPDLAGPAGHAHQRQRRGVTEQSIRRQCLTCWGA